MASEGSAAKYHEVCFKTDAYGSLTLYSLSACVAVAALIVLYQRSQF